MKRLSLYLGITFLAAGLATFLASAPASAQTRTSESDVSALIQRIKEARAREEHATEDMAPPDSKSSASTEAKPATPAEASAKAADEKKKVADERARQDRARAEAEKIARNPRDYVRSMANPTRPSASDALRSLDTDRSAADIVSRIRENRSPDEAKDKAKREKEEKEAVTRVTPGTEAKGGAAPDYSRFLTPSRGAEGTVGGELVTQRALPQTAPDPISSVTPGGASTLARKPSTGGLADPSQDPTLYQKEAERTLGLKAALPSYADKGLLGVYATNQFSQAVQQQRDARFDPGTSLNRVYDVYKQLQKTPDTSSIIGRRDVYVPNAQDFQNPSYRGSIYEMPFAVDPNNRNYSQSSTLSQYSNSAYRNLNVGESWTDYYTREYGVTPSFAPLPSSSRAFDVNTIKQWSVDLRQNYGVDITPGSMSYGDMYRLQTGLRKH